MRFLLPATKINEVKEWFSFNALKPVTDYSYWVPDYTLKFTLIIDDVELITKFMLRFGDIVIK